MKFIFLYTEIATYFTACCNELQKKGEVHVVRYPVNKEAPFQFVETENTVKYYERNKFDHNSLTELIKNIGPDVIFCSGWIDKEYLKICRQYFKKIPTVLCMDTKWKGNLKQSLATLASPFVLKNKFSHVWVPGDSQMNYAKKLGFKSDKIFKGYYCADTVFFSTIFQQHKEAKQKSFPKRFLFVGRYYEFKGITDLWQAFIELDKKTNNDWELWCLGTGDIEPIVHPKIKHFGFVQPADLGTFISACGIFILPSRFEPWAVVVHEFGAAGMPMILSNEVGASEAFLEEGKNGFTFKAGDIIDLEEKLRKISSLSDESLNLMGETGVKLAAKINPENWVNTALNIANDAK